jgi:hypothetical protein
MFSYFDDEVADQNDDHVVTKKSRQELPCTVVVFSDKNMSVHFVDQSLVQSLKVTSIANPMESASLPLAKDGSILDLDHRREKGRENASAIIKQERAFILEIGNEIARLNEANRALKGKENSKAKYANSKEIAKLRDQQTLAQMSIRSYTRTDLLLEACDDPNIDRLCDDIRPMLLNSVVPGEEMLRNAAKGMTVTLEVDESFFRAIVRPPQPLTPAIGSLPVVLVCIFDGVSTGGFSTGYIPYGDLPAPLRATCQEGIERMQFFNCYYCNIDVPDDEYDFKDYVLTENDLHFHEGLFAKQDAMLEKVNDQLVSSLPENAYIGGFYYINESC